MRNLSEPLVRRRRRTPPAGLLSLAVVVALAGCGQQREHPSQPQRVSIDLQPLNGSGVNGTADLELVGNRLTVDIRAHGLEPSRIHGQAIHGFPSSGRASACDFSGPGRVDATTGDHVYGPTLVSLQPFPTVGSNGQLRYRLTFTVRRGDVQPLGSRALVLQGLTPHGGRPGAVYDPALPAACGKVRGGSV